MTRAEENAARQLDCRATFPLAARPPVDFGEPTMIEAFRLLVFSANGSPLVNGAMNFTRLALSLLS